MADVVGQRQRLGQFRIQPQRRGQRAAIWVTSSVCVRRLRKWSEGEFGGQPGEDLGLAGQAAKGARVQNAGGVAGKGSAIGMRRLGVRAAGQFAIPADGNPRGEAHLSSSLDSGVRHRRCALTSAQFLPMFVTSCAGKSSRERRLCAKGLCR
jgi:hypothetical protein